MKGRNKLELCQAEVIEALQFYFKTELFKEGVCPKISTIGSQSVNGCPTITVYFDGEYSEKAEIIDGNRASDTH